MTNDDDLSHIKARHQAYVTGLEPAIANPNPPPCPVEAYPAAAAIMRDAGWKPHDRWGVYTRGTLVMGFSPDGQNFDVKNWGLDIRGPDTPDDPVEAAQWLVALRTPLVILTTEATLDPLASLPEEQQSQGHEGDGETGAEAEGADALGELSGAEASGGDDADAGAGSGVPDEDSTLHGAVDFADDFTDALIDADFTEDPLLEFGGEVLEEHPEEAPPPQDRFYGLDDLDRRRSLRIGDVVRISRLKQAEIALLMGDDDFAAIQNAVLRDTVDGFYKGPPDIYATFVELSRHKSAINRVKAAEADKVAFLEAATRPDLEAFNPDADWP